MVQVRGEAILLKWRLCLAQDAVDLCATHWADALCHAAARIRDFDVTFEGTLLFALNAVGLALVFLSHNDPPIAAATRISARVLPVLSVRTR